MTSAAWSRRTSPSAGTSCPASTRCSERRGPGWRCSASSTCSASASRGGPSWTRPRCRSRPGVAAWQCGTCSASGPRSTASATTPGPGGCGARPSRRSPSARPSCAARSRPSPGRAGGWCSPAAGRAAPRSARSSWPASAPSTTRPSPRQAPAAPPCAAASPPAASRASRSCPPRAPPPRAEGASPFPEVIHRWLPLRYVSPRTPFHERGEASVERGAVGGARHRQALRRGPRPGRRGFRGPLRRGRRARRRQRRGQEHPGQDPLRDHRAGRGRGLVRGPPGGDPEPGRRPRARHRDRLPGPRAGAGAGPVRQPVPRPRAAAPRAARQARVPRQGGDAPAHQPGLRRPGHRPTGQRRDGGQPVRRAAPERGGQPRRHLGRQGGLHGRADRRPWGGAVGQGARPHPQGPRLRHRGRADQPQPARGVRARRPHRGAAARPQGGPLPRRRHHHGAGHRRHDRGARRRGRGVSGPGPQNPGADPQTAEARKAESASALPELLEDAAELEAAVAPGLLRRRLTETTTWTFLILLGIVAGFTLVRPGQFATVFNFRNIAVDASGLSILAVGMTFLLITGGIDVRGIPLQLTTTVGIGQLAGVPYVVLIAAVVTAVGAVVLGATRFGRYTYAIGSNAEAARRAGIDVDRHLIKVYALSGLLAGLAGMVSLARFATTTIGGHSTDNLAAIAAVVLGGTSLFGGIGTVLGTVVGVFIPAVLQNGFVILGVQPFWQQVAVGAVLIVAVYIDQLKRRAQERGERR